MNAQEELRFFLKSAIRQAIEKRLTDIGLRERVQFYIDDPDNHTSEEIINFIFDLLQEYHMEKEELDRALHPPTEKELANANSFETETTGDFEEDQIEGEDFSRQ